MGCWYAPTPSLSLRAAPGRRSAQNRQHRTHTRSGSGCEGIAGDAHHSPYQHASPPASKGLDRRVGTVPRVLAVGCPGRSVPSEVMVGQKQTTREVLDLVALLGLSQ